MSRWGEQLDLLIRSRTPILWIHQQEEERLIRLLGNACQRLGQRTLLRWDFVGGLQGGWCATPRPTPRRIASSRSW